MSSGNEHWLSWTRWDKTSKGVPCSCWITEMFFLLAAAILYRAHPVGHAGPGEDASIYTFGQQVSPVHGEERGRPKGDKGEGD